ncbi:hypothetical protein A9K55_000292 [Cordyceps militaris]|uniref:Uncharacterized protein n=1 Tax=Cordyceps militaris TaxID=73501 RepID=A0A2H4SVW2_CORMI|nr:hypothetical protein A9K55_000292 [Cordyceps militaris]
MSQAEAHHPPLRRLVPDAMRQPAGPSRATLSASPGLQPASSFASLLVGFLQLAPPRAHEKPNGDLPRLPEMANAILLIVVASHLSTAH